MGCVKIVLILLPRRGCIEVVRFHILKALEASIPLRMRNGPVFWIRNSFATRQDLRPGRVGRLLLGWNGGHDGRWSPAIDAVIELQWNVTQEDTSRSLHLTSISQSTVEEKN